MAPNKSNITVSASAGAGMNIKKTTRGNISKSSTAKGSTKATSKPPPAMRAYTRMPQSNYPKSGPMQTHLLKRAVAPRPPRQSLTITRPSLRKRLPSDTASLPSAASTSAASTSSDSEGSTSAASKVAAFHQAPGLSFEELHVRADNDTTAADLPASKNMPQKNSNSTIKMPAKTSTGKTKATKSASRKPMVATGDETQVTSFSAKRSVSTETKPIAKKRAADSDGEASQSPTKRFKLLPPRLPSKSAQPVSALVKSLKIKVNPPTVTPAVPAPSPSADKPTTKTKGAPVITKNGKVKKTPEYAVEHAFKGTPSNHGTSVECPKFGSLSTPWSCANLACATGMTWVPRDTKDPKTGKGPMGRKVISQFFGRNKGATKNISPEVWHITCRKDYQRARYAAEHGTADELARQVIGNLREQLIRLKLWRPDALFQVQLDKGASDRLNSYFALLRQHGNDEAAALAAIPAPKDPKKVKPEEAFPPALAEAFSQRFKTAGKDATANYDDIEAVVAWSEEQIDAGNSTVFVPAEFLINPTQDGEVVNDVATNFAEWEADRARRIAAAELATKNAASSSVPNTSTTAAQPQDVMESIEDPEATESESESEPGSSTPTPAPRHAHFSTSSSDPMALLRDLNEQAARQGYHARSDRSYS
ncbi:hypothetical protein Q7P35_007347 [Cladosporium inversicolor]